MSNTSVKLKSSDEARFYSFWRIKSCKIEYVSSDELWSSVDNIIAKYKKR